MQLEQLRMITKRAPAHFIAAEAEPAAHALLRIFATRGDGQLPAAVRKFVSRKEKCPGLCKIEMSASMVFSRVFGRHMVFGFALSVSLRKSQP